MRIGYPNKMEILARFKIICISFPYGLGTFTIAVTETERSEREAHTFYKRQRGGMRCGLISTHPFTVTR